MMLFINLPIYTIQLSLQRIHRIFCEHFLNRLWILVFFQKVYYTVFKNRITEENEAGADRPGG